METHLNFLESRTKHNDILRVLIVGCGNIAGAYDEAIGKSDFIYTHAGAYCKDKRFSVTACVDPDEERRKIFMHAWGIPAGFSSLEELLQKSLSFDVISICSPTKFHKLNFEVALKLKPKLIFCEKPITLSYGDAQELVGKCAKEGILLAVNYTRRWDSEIIKLQSDIDHGLWGQIRSVNCLYNKGILNNGSHMIDLLRFLFGPLEIYKVGRPILDFSSEDLTMPMWIHTKYGVTIMVNCGNAADYAIFELQLNFSFGRLIIEDGGSSWRERGVIDSNIFSGYRVLGPEIFRSGGDGQAMSHAVDNIYRAVVNNDSLLSSGESALATHYICEKVAEQSLAG